MNRLVDLVFAAVTGLLPPALRSWGLAAFREARELPGPGEALRFALGCLVWAVCEAIRFRISNVKRQGEQFMDLINGPGPRGAAILCGVAAISLGLTYMAAGGAPLGHLIINAGAMAFGLVTLRILTLADRRGHLLSGPINLILGLILLAVSLWGVSAGGVTRWAALGPLIIQPSLMFLPLMVVLFARSRDTLSLGGLMLAALALALQPDRGMAAALATGLTVLALTRPNRHTLAAAAAALVGLGAALAQADRSPAMPFVDQILYSAFALHPLAGVAVVLGSGLLVLPVLAARRANRIDASAYAVFGAFWAAVIMAAALGNYPTPLVGYGGSAIVGYLVGLVVFARRAPESGRASVEAVRQGADDEPLRLAPLS